MKQTKQKLPSDQKIGTKDWIGAGLEVLAADGIDAVRVEPLAVLLGVTKGSFYWHFADRAALHAAMLAAWRARSTSEIIERVEATGGTGTDRLKRLVVRVTSNKKAPRLETAIRAWATTDRHVASVVAEVDCMRTDYVASLLVASGLRPALARVRAKFLYLALIGSFFAEGSAALASDPKIWRQFANTVLR